MLKPKLGVVLAGGGAKGAYQAGFLKALSELNIDPDIVTGTSIGALNGCLMAQKQTKECIELWQKVTMQDVLAHPLPDRFDIDTFLLQSNRTMNFFKNYVKEKGADITPLIQLINHYCDEQKLYESNISFGLTTVSYPSLKPVQIDKSLMKGKVRDYLLSSASCFPAFPVHEFEDGCFIDGGYYDNCPIDHAFDLGADEVIVCDLDPDIKHRHYLHKPNVTIVAPSQNPGMFLDFDRAHLDALIQMGYDDTMKCFQQADGFVWTITENEEDGKAYYKALSQLQRCFKMEDELYQTLLKRTRKLMLNEKELDVLALEGLAKSLDFAPSRISRFELESQVLSAYDECFHESYERFPKIQLDTLAAAIKEISSSTLISMIVHQILYPEEKFISVKTYSTLFPYETSLALWLIVHHPSCVKIENWLN